MFNFGVRSAFAIVFIGVVVRVGELRNLRENIIHTWVNLPENHHDYIFDPCAHSCGARFSIFFPLYRKEGYAGTTSQGEKLYLECKMYHRTFTPGCRRYHLCILDTKRRLDWGRNVCWEGGRSDSTPGALLINIITFWTQSNIKKLAHTPINDGA